MTDPKPSPKSSTETNSTLKFSLTVALMIPVLIAIAAGGYAASTDVGAGLPLLAGGLVLLAFNVVVLKVMFSRLEADDESEEDKTNVDGSK